jgi:hypothetical protein
MHERAYDLVDQVNKKTLSFWTTRTPASSTASRKQREGTDRDDCGDCRLLSVHPGGVNPWIDQNNGI